MPRPPRSSESQLRVAGPAGPGPAYEPPDGLPVPASMVSPPSADDDSGASPGPMGRTRGTGGSVGGSSRTGSPSTASGSAGSAAASVLRSRSLRSQPLSVSTGAVAPGDEVRLEEPPRGRSASSAAMAATLDRPWPGSLDRARR